MLTWVEPDSGLTDGNDRIDNRTGLTSSMSGGNGNDTLIGSGADDFLTGNAGTDSANGRAGTDTCIAESRGSCEQT